MSALREPNPLGGESVNEFDAAGRLVDFKDELDHETEFEYDLLGRLVAVQAPEDRDAEFEYLVGGDEDRVLAPEGRTLRQVYDRFGRVASDFDGEDNETSFTYDAAGQVVTVTDPLGAVTVLTYNELGQVLTVTEADGLSIERVTEYDYEDKTTGLLSVVTDPLSRQTKLDYDAAGRMTEAIFAYGSQTVTPYEVNYEYDFLDRAVEITRPGSRVTEYEYRPLGDLVRITDLPGHPTLERETTFTYDAHSNRTGMTDPLEQATAYAYDELDRLTKITDSEDGETLFGYDAASRLTSLTDPEGNETKWGYDAADRKTLEIDPLLNETVYGYDAADRLTSIVDRLGRARVFEYNAADRMTAETWYTDDTLTTLVQEQTSTYDPNGNLLTATDPDGNYTLTYDKLNRPDTVIQPFGIKQVFTFDKADNRTKVEDFRFNGSTYDALGITVSKFDDLNRLWNRELAVGGTNVLKAEWNFDAIGDLDTVVKSEWLSGAWSAEGKASYSFDALGRLESLVHTNGSGSTLFRGFDYAYDLADRVTKITTDDGGTPVSTSFDYDATNQLKAEGTRDFKYDGNFNRTFIDYGEAGQIAFTISDKGNRLLDDGTWEYDYDAEGNVTTKTDAGDNKWSYEFDHRNQMVRAEYFDGAAFEVTKTVEYDYDAFGNRLERRFDDGTTLTVERFAYDGWDSTHPPAAGSENFDAIFDLDGDDDITMRRVFGGGFDEVLARQDANGDVDWYAADRQGSVHALFDNSETLSGEVAYDAFGNVTSGTLADRYGYAGREWDDVLGLQYNRDRMYNPSAGRWLSDDPAGFAAGLTNLASYVGNDPLNWTDPSGLEGDDEGSAFANGPVCADAQTMALMEYLVNRPQTSGGPVDSDDGPPPALNPDGTLQELTPENVRKMGGTVVWKADGTVEYTYYAHGDMDNGARVTGRLDSNGRVIEQQIIGAHNQMQQFEKNWAENLVDGWRDVREVVHTGLDVLGMIPGVGAIPDLINGGIYLLEGDYENAALSGVAAIPGIGDAAGAAKIGRKIIGKGDDAIKGAKGAGKPPAIKPSTPKPTQPHHPGAPPSSTLRPNANPPGTPRGLIGCFVAGTMLLTLRGLVPIELLRRGDFVLSQSEDDPKGLPEYKMVLETHQRYSAVIAITIDGHVIRMTQDHPLYVLDGRGWVQAHDLKAEDQVQGLDGRALKVGAIDCAVKKEVVYNLTVADYHTFFIGAEEWDTAVWVHNVDPCATPPPAKKRPGTRGHPDHIKDVRGPGLDQANSIAGPGERVVTEGRIEGFPKIKRRPDNQVIGVDGKTRVVIESERLPEGPYHKKRIKQLKRAGIEVITRILQ